MNSFKDYYKSQYYVKGWSFDHFFCLVIYYLIFALPFYFSFGGENFWLNQKHDILLIQLSTNGLYAMQINYIASNSSNIPEVSTNIPGAASAMRTIPYQTVQIVDQKNQTSIDITIGKFSSLTITSINFILYYDINVIFLSKKLYSALKFSLNGNVQSADIYGIINLQQSEPISGLTAQFTNIPPYYPSYQPPTTFNSLSEELMRSKLKINSQLEQDIQIGTSETRTIRVKLNKKTIQPISYYPSLLETLKFSFSRYLAFFLISYYFFTWFIKINAQQGILDTFVKDQIIPQSS